MITPFGGPNYIKNSERVRGDTWPCVICGLPIHNLAGVKWITVINGGGDFGPADSDMNHPGYMGCFPIGPECYRKHKTELDKFLQ